MGFGIEVIEDVADLRACLMPSRAGPCRETFESYNESTDVPVVDLQATGVAP